MYQSFASLINPKTILSLEIPDGIRGNPRKKESNDLKISAVREYFQGLIQINAQLVIDHECT